MKKTFIFLLVVISTTVALQAVQWQKTALLKQEGIIGFEVSKTGQVYVYGYKGYLAISNDFGQNFEEIDMPVKDTISRLIPVNDDFFLFVTESNEYNSALYKFDLKTKVPILLKKLTNYKFSSVLVINDSTLFCYGDRISITIDEEHHNTFIDFYKIFCYVTKDFQNWDINKAGDDYPNGLSFIKKCGNKLIGFESSKNDSLNIVKSSDFGLTWQGNGKKLWWVRAVGVYDSTAIWARSNDNKWWKTKDLGENWEKVNYIGSDNFKFFNKDTFLIHSDKRSGVVISLTFDGGKTFQTIAPKNEFGIFGADAYKDSIVFCLTTDGIFYRLHLHDILPVEDSDNLTQNSIFIQNSQVVLKTNKQYPDYYSLYDLSGKALVRQSINNPIINEIRINLSELNLSSGKYLITFTGKNFNKTFKIFIE